MFWTLPFFQGCGKARNNPSDSNHARESRTVCQSQHTAPSATMLACDRRNWLGRFSSLDLARREWRAFLRPVSAADTGAHCRKTTLISTISY
jgi:hypothetical protein